jgi:D-beta-D-heptose 7-phosphate kinase/D-beta-D-heptose 1-phosphate adenosyltransferase
MATMVWAQVAGAPAIEAAALANHAAGVVVARVGTAAIEVDDLLAELN